MICIYGYAYTKIKAVYNIPIQIHACNKNPDSYEDASLNKTRFGFWSKINYSTEYPHLTTDTFRVLFKHRHIYVIEEENKMHFSTNKKGMK